MGFWLSAKNEWPSAYSTVDIVLFSLLAQHVSTIRYPTGHLPPSSHIFHHAPLQWSQMTVTMHKLEKGHFPAVSIRESLVHSYCKLGETTDSPWAPVVIHCICQQLVMPSAFCRCTETSTFCCGTCIKTPKIPMAYSVKCVMEGKYQRYVVVLNNGSMTQ
jgi:hypothetical protein